MSEIIDKAKALLNDCPAMAHSDITAALDYAEELESRLKSCQSCKSNDLPYGCEQCLECRAIGGPGNYYPKWELAPRRSS